MTLEQIYKKVSAELNLPEKLVEETYKSYWKWIKDSILTLPLKETLSEEEFSKLNTNFNIPSLGKLSCTYDRYIGMKKRFNYIKKLRNGRLDEEIG